MATDDPSASPAAPRVRSLAQVLEDALVKPEKVPMCLLHENMTNVRDTKAGTKVTLGVPKFVFSCDDAMWFTGELGRPESRKPKYVGILVFVPTEIYEKSDS